MGNPLLGPILLGLACVNLGGCVRVGPQQEQPWRIFTLTPLAVAPHSQPVSAPTPVLPAIGIGPVHLPGYLDQEQIVTRISQNGFALSDIDRWAEPLEHNIAQVLIQNLSTLLETDQVIPHPWPGQQRPAYQLEIDVLSFDTDTAGTAQLQARWLLRDLTRRQAIAEKEVRLTAAAAGSSTEQAVAALSKALADFSVGLAGAIREFVRPDLTQSAVGEGDRR
jgi:uncharacterized lipoprotein YmbA